MKAFHTMQEFFAHRIVRYATYHAVEDAKRREVEKRGSPCGSDAAQQISDASDADEKLINARVFCVLQAGKLLRPGL